MAEQPERDQQTEAPTARHKQEAVTKGDILQSRDLATALVILAAAAWLLLAGPWFVRQCLALVRDGLSLTVGELQTFDPGAQTFRLLGLALLPLASLFAIALLACIGAPSVLGSLGFRVGAMGFKASRINPVAGLRRMFGSHGLTELVKAIAKATLLGAIGWWMLADKLRVSAGLARQDTRAAIAELGSLVAIAVLLLGLGLAAIAAVDVPAQIILRNARLRMTKQQVKDESRQTEGAPELKNFVRQRQHEVLMSSARKAISDATLILTNPTHFAVALRYRPGKDAAPTVVARGRGETADAIRALAKEHSVMVLEYPQLTRAIYYTSRSGQAIAEDLFLAVATILAFVFNIERALTEGIPPPSVDVPDAKRFDENGVREASG